MTTSPDERLEHVLASWDTGLYMAFLRPVTDALLKGAGIRSGLRVLDVGCGFGDPALDVATAVGPRGVVVGVDHDPKSLELARKRAAASGLANVSFEVGEAQALPFPDGSFDAVVSRLLVVYFPNPVPVLREMWRVLAPGGRVAVATWAMGDRNPLMNHPMDALRRHLPPSPPPPQPTDRMDTRDPRILQQALERAGFAEAAGALVPMSLAATTADAERYWEERRAGSPMSLQMLARLAPEQQAVAERDAVDSIRQLIAQGRATGEIAVASGRKP